MSTRLDLAQTVAQCLTHDKVESLFNQMGCSLTNSFTPNEYQANVQVITWAILEKLTASNSFPVCELTEDNVKPIVDSAIKDMCKFISQEALMSMPDVAPSGYLSRVTWWTLKCIGRELEF